MLIFKRVGSQIRYNHNYCCGNKTDDKLKHTINLQQYITKIQIYLLLLLDKKTMF